MGDCEDESWVLQTPTEVPWSRLAKRRQNLPESICKGFCLCFQVTWVIKQGTSLDPRLLWREIKITMSCQLCRILVRLEGDHGGGTDF